MPCHPLLRHTHLLPNVNHLGTWSIKLSHRRIQRPLEQGRPSIIRQQALQLLCPQRHFRNRDDQGLVLARFLWSKRTMRVVACRCRFPLLRQVRRVPGRPHDLAPIGSARGSIFRLLD